MGEKSSKLRPYKFHYYCDCGGEMKPSGIMLMSMPPKYPHVCESCGFSKILKKEYPYLSFKKE